MGYGSYSHEAHRALIQTRSGRSKQEVFKQRGCHNLMNPHGVKARESRDSDDHPNSLGIVFALDVTGSMQDIPVQLATEHLPSFMKTLEGLGVVDPQVLFTAVGDAKTDNAPLQVGQFETTGELMDQWLTYSYLEGGGGGNGAESYELALYFLARHTAMDCVEKRQKKGLCFMTGDDNPFATIQREEVEKVIGDQLDENLHLTEVIEEVSKSFDVFFLIPDARRRKHEARWREFLGSHVICMERASDTCYVAAALTALREGSVTDLGDLAAKLSAAGVDSDVIRSTRAALEDYSLARSA